MKAQLTCTAGEERLQVLATCPALFPDRLTDARKCRASSHSKALLTVPSQRQEALPALTKIRSPLGSTSTTNWEVKGTCFCQAGNPELAPSSGPPPPSGRNQSSPASSGFTAKARRLLNPLRTGTGLSMGTRVYGHKGSPLSVTRSPAHCWE